MNKVSDAVVVLLRQKDEWPEKTREHQCEDRSELKTPDDMQMITLLCREYRATAEAKVIFYSV